MVANADRSEAAWSIDLSNFSFKQAWSGALPALAVLNVEGISASDAAIGAVYEARPDLDA